jgi:hypothetical protein
MVVVLASVDLASGRSCGHMKHRGNEITQRFWEWIPAYSELVLEHGDRGWKALEDQNGLGTLNEGIVFLRGMKNFMPRCGCVTNWYQRKVTTLDLLGLMDESRKNHI